MSPPLDRRERMFLWLILGLTALRLIIAAFIPLAFDEAYYWRWSLHLAPGYYDHPPMVAVWIAVGRSIFGDTEFGVRVLFILSALPATWAVWRAAAILTGSREVAATSALFFNLTLMVGVGTAIATPDTPLLLAAAFVLLFFAKLIETGRGGWWLAIGAAIGFGLLSKYTALFWGASALVATLMLADLRRWLRTPWPYIGAALAFAIFSPTITWNASHDWISFRYQFGRAGDVGWQPQFVPDFLAALFGLATPSIFVLSTMGLLAVARGNGASRNTRVLLGALVWPFFLYFLWHSLHTRVEGNWTAPMFPPAVIIAALAVHSVNWPRAWAGFVRFSYRAAAPVALALTGVIYLQAITGWLPIGAADPTARTLGAGMKDLAAQLDALREKSGAKGLLTSGYALTSWLSFYAPHGTPVVQIDQRSEWLQEPEPSANLLSGPLLFVGGATATPPGEIYSEVQDLGLLTRHRGALDVESYRVFLVSAPERNPLDGRSAR